MTILKEKLELTKEVLETTNYFGTFKDKEYISIEKLETKSNYFSFDLKMFLKNKSFNLFRELTNINHDQLLIEFTFSDRTSLDMLCLFLEKEKINEGISYEFFCPTSFQSLGSNLTYDLKSGFLLIDLKTHHYYDKELN